MVWLKGGGGVAFNKTCIQATFFLSMKTYINLKAILKVNKYGTVISYKCSL